MKLKNKYKKCNLKGKSLNERVVKLLEKSHFGNKTYNILNLTPFWEKVCVP